VLPFGGDGIVMLATWRCSHKTCRSKSYSRSSPPRPPMCCGPSAGGPTKQIAVLEQVCVGAVDQRMLH